MLRTELTNTFAFKRLFSRAFDFAVEQIFQLEHENLGRDVAVVLLVQHLMLLFFLSKFVHLYQRAFWG